MGMCRTVYRQIKIGMWVTYVALFFVLCLGISCNSYAKPMDQETFSKQLEQALARGNVYTINQDGSGDFLTIQEGVNAAKSEDTLLIYPGVYNEAVEIVDKTVHLIGIDRDNCILKYESVDYDKVPLMMGAGEVANITIYGYKKNQGIMTDSMMATNVVYYDNALESIESWQKKFSGYALHIDQNYTYGKDVFLKNCKMVSNTNYTIGIGSRGKSRITLEECEVISKGSGGCIYFHNMNIEEMGGEAYFTMKNCELKSYISPYVISVHSTGNINPVFLTFQNIRTSAIAYDTKESYNWTNMNTSFDVDEVRMLNDINMLSLTGLYSSMNDGCIKVLDIEESVEYVSTLIEEISTLTDNGIFVEGITYLSTERVDETSDKEERIDDLQIKQRHVIDIYNFSKFIGDGWCGLEHMYLTPESYGNTLIEMNYPIIP